MINKCALFIMHYFVHEGIHPSDNYRHLYKEEREIKKG